MSRRGAGALRVARALLAAAGFGLVPRPAAAHGFGQRYDLALPLSLYVVGAGAVVLLSFVLLAVFARGADARAGYPRVDLLRGRAGRLLTHPMLAGAVKALGLAAFVLVVVAGWIGDPRPERNFAPTCVWVIGWVGVAFVSALLGNVWTLLNPWRTAFGWLERLVARSSGRPLGLGLRPPGWLGVWPALALFFGIAWLELVAVDGAKPVLLAKAASVYSAITFAGMFAFGREVWLRTGEPLTLFFGLFARVAPTEIRVSDPGVCEACPVACRDQDGDCVDCADCFARAAPDQRELDLRPFAAGLLRHERVHPSMTCFAIGMLGTVTFDGLEETPLWVGVRRLLDPLAPGSAGERAEWVGTAGLVAVPLLLLGAYALTRRAMVLAAGRSAAPAAVAGSYASSLVPIAVGYHLAHYVSFLLVQGQLAIPLLSDPFGWGWDLFGTAGYRIDIGIVGARFVWNWSVGAIVTGHLVGVWVGHRLAQRGYVVDDGSPGAWRSQLPLLALMVAYTMLSLWIIAQPIVE